MGDHSSIPLLLPDLAVSVKGFCNLFEVCLQRDCTIIYGFSSQYLQGLCYDYLYTETVLTDEDISQDPPLAHGQVQPHEARDALCHSKLGHLADDVRTYGGLTEAQKYQTVAIPNFRK